MRVKVFRATNFMGLKKVAVEPGETNVVLVAGKNGAGKSSVMKAFDAVFGGLKEAPRRPVRDGEDAAEIEVELEDKELAKEFTVTRRFTADGKSSLKVSSKDGRLSSPQKILDKILGARMLDPLAFMRLDEKEQRDVLLGCVDIGIDLDQHEKDRKRAFENRKNANRDVKRLKIELEAIPDPGEIPAPVDADELLAKLDELTAKESEKVNAQHALTEMRAEVGRKKQDIATAEIRLKGAKNVLESADKTHAEQIAEMKMRHLAELEELEARQAAAVREQEDAVTELTSEVARAKDSHATFVEEGKQAAAEVEKRLAVDYSKEINEIREAISSASATNTERAHLEARAQQRAKIAADLADAEGTAAGYNEKLKRLDQLKATSLKEAHMPVEGLDIGEACLLYGDKGLPLDQASGAAKLQVALAIAAALSPHLDDIWVQDGPLLDKDSMVLVKEFAKERNLRFWLERVGEDDDGCIIIEEGLLKA